MRALSRAFCVPLSIFGKSAGPADTGFAEAVCASGFLSGEGIIETPCRSTRLHPLVAPVFLYSLMPFSLMHTKTSLCACALPITAAAMSGARHLIADSCVFIYFLPRNFLGGLSV